jgi:hypothetical protein
MPRQNTKQIKNGKPAKKKKVTRIEHLTFDTKNANKHSEYGTSLLNTSIRNNGMARSIVISDDNVIIAGNGVAETAGQLGMMNVKVIETDGSEVIAVKRTDIKSGTPEFFNLALADNIVAQKNIVMDAQVVEAIVEEYGATQFWAEVVLTPIIPKVLDKIDLPDNAKNDLVQATFTMTGAQAAVMQEGLKISKRKFKKQFASTGNENSNGNALFFIFKAFVDASKAE